MRRLLIGTSVAVAFVLMGVATARAQTQQQAEEAIGFADSYKLAIDGNYGSLADRIESELGRHSQYMSLIPYYWDSMTQADQDALDNAMTASYGLITDSQVGAIKDRDDAYDDILSGDVELNLAWEYFTDSPPLYGLALSAAEAAAKDNGVNPHTGHYPDACGHIISGEATMDQATAKLNEAEEILQRYILP